MGLRIIKPDTNIDFIGLRRLAFVVSGLLILVGALSLFIKGGPRYGIDFAGGIIVQVKFDSATELSQVRGALADVDMPGLVIQRLGDEADNEFLLRTSTSDIPSEQVRSMVSEAFKANLAGKSLDIQRLEMVGPKVGADLRTKALEALFFAVLLIAIYISGRFEQRWMAAGIMAAALFGGVSLLDMLGADTGWLIVAAMLITLVLCWVLKLNYALGAVVALIHDVMITVGVFSLMDKEFDLTIIAALLTIIGYSLNDTIIVFDRIRENIKNKTSDSFAKTINTSINQTLSRTLLTSGTTLIVVVCLFVMGGAVIHDFALALLIGIFVGTYSSIFVASPILLGFGPSLLPDKTAAKAV
ncbi:MAG: protein translocase subunit SecF [Desulfovibrionaceae bacterium]|nr:protein translocase subunit SecF [Desulfovibrionaceae bacterium]